MKQRRPTTFNEARKVQFGISIATRTPTGKVNSVTCRFCHAFGREKSGRVSKKRRELTTIQAFKPPFRSDNMRAHLSNQHKKKWGEYQALSLEEKMTFFDREVPYINTIVSHFGITDQREYAVHAPIVDDVIYKFLSCAEPADANTDSQTQVLSTLLVRDNDDVVTLRIANGCHFEMVVGNVSIGMSFRQVARSVQVARNVNQLSHLSGLWEGKVRLYVQAVTAINLQQIRNLMNDKRCWAYSIAMDSATNRGDSFVDVRARIHVGTKIENIHLLAIPLTESHTGAVMFQVVQDLLCGVLGIHWWKKLLSVATDGAANMTGRYQGVVTRFEQLALPGFFRIWCAAHQLDLAVQFVMSRVIKDSFRDPLVGLIGYLRRQINLRAEMGTTCPALSTTRWMSLGNCTSWILKHRERIEQYLEEKAPSVAPDTSWWVIVACVSNFMAPVDVCFKSMQGRDTLVAEQNVLIRKLADSLKEMLKITAVTGMDMLLHAEAGDVLAQCTLGSQTLVIRERDVLLFVEDCSLDSANDLSMLDAESRANVLKTVSNMVLHAFVKISTLEAERDVNNAPAENLLPPVLPCQLEQLRPRQFFDIIESQRERLLASHDNAFLRTLGSEFKDFKRYVSSCSAARNDLGTVISATEGCGAVFQRSWAPFEKRFKNLVIFCGGMATTFPGTATVESDFSNIHWEADEYRTALTSLSLEGILHCKQFASLERLAHK